MKNITSLWVGQVYGTATELQSFTGSDGQKVQRLVVAYFGGSLGLAVDDEQYSRLAGLDFTDGVDVRVAVKLVVRNGFPRLQVLDYVLQGEREFKPISPAEKMRGSLVRGCGRVVRRESYRRSSGAVVCVLELQTFGGPLSLSVTPEQYEQVPAAGYVRVVCHAEEVLTYSKGGHSVATQFVLEQAEPYSPKTVEKENSTK